MKRNTALALLSGAALTSLKAFQSNPDPGHVGWVTQSLPRMLAIKPGTTRAVLLTVFTTEGGLSTGLQRTYVSQDCPYFHVDVKFEAAGRPPRDADGRVTLEEDGRDVITEISRPYLDFYHAD